ncbi:MAG: ExbD/TolR family protein [Acidobacteriota bacterium]|jgi:biopolymer transport protein ExbD
MSMNVSKGHGAMSDINVTPLVDILLVLIIIFMVITPILQKGFTTQVPPKAPPSTNPSQSNAIVLQIDAGSGMSINRQPVTLQDLGERLGAIFATRADKVLFVDVDDKAPYESVVKALDIARGPGKVETIGFVLN